MFGLRAGVGRRRRSVPGFGGEYGRGDFGTLRFLLDEGADIRLAAHLVALGHNVTSIVRDDQRSIGDDEVLAIAVRERRIVTTDDTDFGELIFWRRLEHAGVMLFRLAGDDLGPKIQWIDAVLARHRGDLDQFIVVTDRGIRVRRVSPRA